MAQRKRIGVYMDMARNYGREMFMGMIRYARSQRCQWDFTGDPTHPSLELIRDCDGSVIHLRNQEALDFSEKTNRPCVIVLSGVEEHGKPCVVPNDFLVGQFVADHLIERGFSHLAFFSLAMNRGYIRQRAEGFVTRSREAKANVSLFREMSSITHYGQPINEDLTEVVNWLRKLPKPVGIMADNDTRGLLLLRACRQAGLKVPGQVAIIGVDNDDVICEMAETPLSSVAMPFEAIGYQAAEHLHLLLEGRQPVQPHLRIDPLDVVLRASSDTLALGDEQTLHAVRFIWEHAGDSINVEDVVEQAKCSRRSLERRFRKYLGRSPRDEIVRVRIDLAKRALADSDEPMPRVASAAGFTNAKKLSTHFVAHTGMTPTEYRRRYRSL